MFKATFIDTDGNETTVDIASDEYLLDAAEDAGVDAPSSCRAGACSACACKLVSGTVNQEDQCFLDDEQMEEGFVMSCVAYATSDVTVRLGADEEL